MPDFRVTFKGDLGNLAQFDAAVKNSAIASAREIENANKRVVASIAKVTGPLSADSGAGFFTNKQRTEIDAYNRTFRQTGDVIRRVVKDYEILGDKAGNFKLEPIFDNAYFASYDKAVGNLDNYEKALKRVAKSEKEIIAVRQQTRTGQLAIAENIYGLNQRKAGLASRLSETINASNEAQLLKIAQDNLELATGGKGFVVGNQVVRRESIEAQIRDLRNELAQPLSSTVSRPKNFEAQKLAQIAELEKTLASPQDARLAPFVQRYTQEIDHLKKAITAVGAPLQADIAQTEAEIAQLQAASAKLERSGARKEAGIQRRNPAYQDLKRAANEIPPIQRDLAAVLNQSKDLRKNLLAGGLGGGAKFGTQEFQRALAQQEASVSRFTENLRTGVNTVQGSFRDLKTGILKDFTVDLDNNGKVIGRWGGQLRGAGTQIAQVVRNFQKVVQWTVATTAVFGALATVVGQLQSINELNTSLARFSITAQASAEDTQKLFTQLSQVAINTATPLKEIVTVADDIALATRTANQSTEEWHASIIDLTTAVGIFTNLTGKDTVSAAEQLSSAFKQLDIEPSELIGILNKVTAVAGGQANAIADIVQSVAGLAEAAKAAGFTVDEQIAAVQVLAQVTNKTSAEIATSFKNLFGSVSSVGSEKILAEFDIAIRDSEGGIRDFLDIYRDVANALKQGIIPQNRLPDVLRGISGGPRRAPDAAALLSNIGRIDEVVARSAGATNEALIANAKILDTNQAKIIQFQNAVDVAVFEKFGKAVSDLTDVLTSFGIVALKTFNGIDSGLISLVLQLGLFAGGTRLLGGLLKNVLPSWAAFRKTIEGTSKSFKDLYLNQRYSIQATTAFGRPAYALGKGSQNLVTGGKTYKPGQILPNDIALAYGAGPGQRAINRFQGMGTLGKIGVTGGLAVGSAFALKGLADLNKDVLDKQLAGNILQIGGAFATLIPGLQAVGLAAIAAGFGLSAMAGDTQAVKKSAAELSSEVFTLSESIKNSQSEADNYREQQQEALTTINELQDKTKKTAEEQLKLSDATGVYASATLGLAAANREVSDSFDLILSKIPGLTAKYSEFKDLVAKGGLSADDPFLKKLQQQLAADILRNSGQGIYTGPTLGVSDTYRPSRSGTLDTGTIATFGKDMFDLTELIENPEKLRRLFNLDRDTKDPFYGFGGDIPRNETSIRLLQGALGQLFEQVGKGESTITEEELKLLVAAINELSGAASSFTQNATALTQQNALIQARVLTGDLSPEQGQAALVSNQIAQLLNQATSRFRPPSTGPDERGEVDPRLQANIALIKELNAAAEEGRAVSNTTLVEAAKNVLQLKNSYASLAEGGNEAFNKGIIQWLQQAGVEQSILDTLAKQYNVTLAQTLATNEELIASLDSAKTSARQAFADRSLQLQIAENSGDFEENSAGLAKLRAQNDAAYQSTLSLIDSIGVLSGTSFVSLNNALAQTIGLQGLYISQNDPILADTEALAQRQSELAGKLIEAAVAAGVNAEGIRRIKAEIPGLIALINAIPTYKQVIIDIKTYHSEGGKSGRGGKDPASQARLVKALREQAEALRKGTDPQSQIDKIIDEINSIIESGTGSNFGQLPTSKAAKAAKTAAYNKPGLLDIPEEIINASNTSQLLQQAIKNARNLQSKIPGESKANKNEIVELLNGTKRILETRGIGEEYLRRAMDELTGEIKRQNDLLSKADTIRRIRVNTEGFAGIANVPINSQSGVSVGGPQGPISISLDVNGTVLTPAQFSQFADLIAASLKRQLAT